MSNEHVLDLRSGMNMSNEHVLDLRSGMSNEPFHRFGFQKKLDVCQDLPNLTMYCVVQ